MKKLLLLFLIVFIAFASDHAQVANTTAYHIACSAAYEGMVYQIQSANKAYRCNGTSWVELSSVDATTSLTKTSLQSGEYKKSLYAIIGETYFKTYESDSGKQDYQIFAVRKNNTANLNNAPGGFHLTPNYFFPFTKARGEKRFELSGAVNIGFNNSRARTDAINANGLALNRSETNSRELSFGLDLHVGTYLIDPRFIKVTADASFARDKGSFDDFETRNGIRGLGFAIDALPTSPYPFRFRYVKQNSNFLDRQGESTNSERSIIGFGWQLRKPKLPALVVNYDKVSYNSKFLASSFFKTKAQTFSVVATDSFRGWNLNSSYNYQSAVEGRTDLKTRQNFLQFQARKTLSKKSDIFIGSFYEQLHLTNGLTGSEQKTAFFNVHTDFNYQPSEKLRTRFFHQFYYSDNNTQNSFGNSNNNNQVATFDTTSFFNSFGGQLTYRVFPELILGATTSANLINSPDDTFESATQLLDVAATISWSKKIKSAYLHANALEGIAYARSNFRNQRDIEFRSFNAGVTFGKVQHALVSANYNYSYRPDIFQIGGYFSENNFGLNITTEVLRPFRLHASVGDSNVVYLSSRGRESFDRMFYSAGLEHRLFSLQFARNTNDGLRDIFATTFQIPTNRMFIVLPKDTLIRDPFLRTNGSFTSAMFRIQPLRDLNIELRYLDDNTFFILTNNVSVKQFDILVTYKLGKFIFSGGVSRQQQMTEGLFSRTRNYYFFRATRTFKIF